MKAHIGFFVFCVSFWFANGAQLWSGNFNYYANAQAMDLWSWDNEVGQYQTYIHGPGLTSDWIELSPSFKNPSDQVSIQGAKVKINGSADWATGGPGMLRNEMIPEGFDVSQDTGTLFYQWSMKQTSSNQLSSANEHQLVFFESHFADIKYGGEGGAKLYFVVNQQIVWSATFPADEWFNFALQVNYNSNQVALWQSTGGNALTQVVAPISTSTSQSEWHVGNLRLPIYESNGDQYQNPAPEWVFYSTVSIQNSLFQPFSSASASSSSSSSSSSSTSTTAKGSTSSKGTSSKPPSSVTTSRSTTGKLTQATTGKATTSKLKSSSTSSSTSSTSSSTSSSTPSPSSSPCTPGNMICATSETYQTCVSGVGGVTNYASPQSCQTGLTCHPSGNYIYCY